MVSLHVHSMSFYAYPLRICSSWLALCRVELVTLSPVHRYSVDIFHILVLQEYWVLTESRTPFMLVLGCVRILIVVFPDHTYLPFEGGTVQIGYVIEIDLECIN